MNFFSKNISKLLISINIFYVAFLAKAVSAYEFSKDSGLIDTSEEVGLDTIGGFSATSVLTLILPFLGTVYLLLMVYAGYLWMMAQGNEEQVRKAKKIIINSSIALAIVLLSYAISYYVISFFQLGLVKGG